MYNQTGSRRSWDVELGIVTQPKCFPLMLKWFHKYLGLTFFSGLMNCNSAALETGRRGGYPGCDCPGRGKNKISAVRTEQACIGFSLFAGLRAKHFVLLVPHQPYNNPER